ncbi:MAG: phage tail sheath family protein [Myxococcales bacterium]|nr:phage tail sheath family protein [Myxococcales bacterium]
MIGRQHPAPGIYERRQALQDRSISMQETAIPAFLGMTSRGPLEKPTKIESFDEFRKLFGRPVETSYLSDAVYGFFSNGGKRCFIIRVAHTHARKGEIATRSSLTVNDSQDRPTLIIEAANEGAWGDQIQVSVTIPESEIKTYLTFDAEKGANKLTVKTSRGFHRGTLVRIHHKGFDHYAVLAGVDSKLLILDQKDALPSALKSSDLVYVEPVTFDLSVDYGGKRELHTGLSLAPGSERFPERYISEQSEFVRVRLADNEAPISDRMPVPTAPTFLAGGLDGIADITPADFIGADEGPGHRYGLAALLDNEDVDLVCAPDLMACREHSAGFNTDRDIETVQEAMLTFCETTREVFAILDVPPDLEIEDALNWRLNFDSHFGAFYYPWISVITPAGQRFVPPSGHMAGVYARCDQAAGPHRAAANEVIQGATHLQRNLDEADVGYLNAHSVNPIRTVPARGIRVWGARTVSSRSEWRYVTVRRVFNMIRRALYHNTQWVVFENNNPRLWGNLERQIKFYLTRLYEQGYFAGETPADAFYVRCDNETNPPERLAAGELVAEIGIAPVRPAEFLTFTLEQQLPEVSTS